MPHADGVSIIQLTAQATLVRTVTVRMEELARRLGELLPSVHASLVRRGISPVGPPFVRYLTMNPTAMKIEAGLPVPPNTPGDGDITPSGLPGGDAARVTHMGSYARLHETHALLDAWFSRSDRKAAGPRWELYVTDPGAEPDEHKWVTHVIAPLAR